ncbi:phosphogluconate dehydrogenase (NAD(+)-dependent, decarboxylating) [Brevibacillus sp. B_LB10_24]|uniref:phosphogluconate dehydrogenase (NAD(+)-dependent, decarboxylating) n=1 Tax=Brevibacillus sp. B_LB10_24 TaxID=3380645 RepID=UPI0038BC2980
MRIGIVGLGKMGFHLGCNMIEKGHTVVGYDVSKETVERFKQKGGIGCHGIEELAGNLSDKPKAIWLMVPAGEMIDSLISQLKPFLSPGDIVIDGGNSFYKDSIRRSEQLQEDGIRFLDVGTSGGIEGAINGLCLMIGGDKDAYLAVEPLIRDIAQQDGFLYTGPAGSGHFLKMVHNGIEYGMMQAIGEGFEILEKGPFTYHYEQVARLWNNGSVIRCWLMELMEKAFAQDPDMSSIKGVMYSSGEGKWTAETAMEFEIAAPVITMSLLMRYRSLQEDTFHGKVVASLRNQFGGHAVEKV